MFLFKKSCTAGQLGAIIYETLRTNLVSDRDLSIEKLVENIGCRIGALDEQYMGEIMIGCMFAAMMAVDRSTSPWMAAQIRNGMQREFFVHLREQGAKEDQIREWEAVLLLRTEEYDRCMYNYNGFEPPWKLGRQFYWNFTGTNDYVAMNIKIATLYLVEVRDLVQEVVNKYGPRLISSPVI